VTNIPRSCLSTKSVNVAGALQIDRTRYLEWCYNVGLFTETSTEMALINPEDPSEGLQITYKGIPNDLCSNGQARKFHIQMMCKDKLNPIPTHALEYTHCEYTVTLPSVYGCPVECPVANRRLCAGNGHCAYDNDANSARCFCNNGTILYCISFRIDTL